MQSNITPTTYDLVLCASKTLSFKLPSQRDRIIAAKWIRKIDGLYDLTTFEKTKYLNLLCIAMQSKMLVGPFMEEPPTAEFNLMKYYHLSPVDIKNMIVAKKYTRPNPCYTEISSDLREYAVYQEIPEFGSHFYYACSLDPITMWRKKTNAILPKGTLESTILSPPINEISKTKAEFLRTYRSYLKVLKKRESEQKPNKKCDKATGCGDHPCEDSGSDYADYQLIGQGGCVSPPSVLSRSGSKILDEDELPTVISFYVGDDPDPYQYKRAKKYKNSRKDPAANRMKTKIKDKPRIGFC